VLGGCRAAIEISTVWIDFLSANSAARNLDSGVLSSYIGKCRSTKLFSSSMVVDCSWADASQFGQPVQVILIQSDLIIATNHLGLWRKLGPDICTEAQSMLTRSRSSFPGLKWGTYLAGTITALPVLGLRPFRGGRWLRLKLPNPRISARPPSASVLANSSRIVRIVSSMSLGVSWGWLKDSCSMSSARVMFR
jgi:hypothetical protein